MTHNVGDWAVIKGPYSEDVGQITKVSEKQVRTRRWGDREAYHQPGEVLFSGDEKTALDLASVLKGLRKRHEDARSQLLDQHKARMDAAIQKANQP